MIIIPAIDLKDGKCVRLLQGKKDEVTVYGDDPGEMAKQWVDMGARLLHVVDLDGAFTGEQKNFESIKAIRKRLYPGAFLNLEPSRPDCLPEAAWEPGATSGLRSPTGPRWRRDAGAGAEPLRGPAAGRRWRLP